MVLPWDQRERCRQRARLASGEEVALFLARGTVLRDGDLLSGEGGRVVRVVAAPEPTYLVRCAMPPCWRAAPTTSATAIPRPRSAPAGSASASIRC
jgi:urease accessory protein UreE